MVCLAGILLRKHIPYSFFPAMSFLRETAPSRPLLLIKGLRCASMNANPCALDSADAWAPDIT